MSYQPQLHLQVDAGLPLTRVGTLVATPLNSIVFLKSSSIKSIADLKGRKVGFSVGGFEDALLRAMLAKHGLNLNDIELINVNFFLILVLIQAAFQNQLLACSYFLILKKNYLLLFYHKVYSHS